MTIKDLEVIAEVFQSFWPPGRESASKYICRLLQVSGVLEAVPDEVGVGDEARLVQVL